MITRAQYLAGDATHRAYYAQFVNEHTIAFVVRCIGGATIDASTDEHMNDIPLRRWDALCSGLPLAMRMETAGDYYTLGGCVCIAKEAARQHKERTR